VPKAAMHEDRAAKARKNKIWLAGQVFSVKSKPISHPVDKTPDRQLRDGVLAANPSHPFAAFSGSERIGHACKLPPRGGGRQVGAKSRREVQAGLCHGGVRVSWSAESRPWSEARLPRRNPGEGARRTGGLHGRNFTITRKLTPRRRPRPPAPPCRSPARRTARLPPGWRAGAPPRGLPRPPPPSRSDAATP